MFLNMTCFSKILPFWTCDFDHLFKIFKVQACLPVLEWTVSVLFCVPWLVSKNEFRSNSQFENQTMKKGTINDSFRRKNSWNDDIFFASFPKWQISFLYLDILSMKRVYPLLYDRLDHREHDSAVYWYDNDNDRFMHVN